MGLSILLLLSVASFALSHTPCRCVEYYVTPILPSNADCPQPCYTLDYYALDTSLLSNRDNVSLLFLEGKHVLNRTLKVSDTKFLLVAGLKDNQLVKHTTIECYSRCALQFKSIQSLKDAKF